MSDAPPPGLGDTPPGGVPPVATGIAPFDPQPAPPSSRPAPPGPQPAAPDPQPAPVDAPGAESPERRGDGGPVHRRHRGRRRLTRRRLLVAGLLVALVVIGMVAWYEVESHPLGGQGPAVTVTVHPGESTSSVDAQLTRSGVVGSSLAFRLWTAVHGQPAVEPGRYLLHQNEPFATVSRQLAGGPDIFDVVVPPGYTVAEVAGSLDGLPGGLAKSFLDQARTGAVSSPYQPVPGASLEGLLGAGTYQVLPGETAHQLLSQMVARFGSEAAAAGLTPTTTVDGLSPYQLVTAASIAQKEGYFTRYLGEVSRVIYNRLAAGMDLDMTSTVLYSLGQDGGPVTPADERRTTPYNTYLHPGLTPTPICVPSAAALAAAVSAPPGAWLYFDLVTAKKGTMVFSSTYTGQVAAEQAAAANAAAQKGGGTGR